MLARDFEVFYYSDVNFQPVSTHAHDYYEFYLFLEGDFSMEIAGKQYPLQKGDLVLIPPSVPHQGLIGDASIPYRRFILWISKDYCSSLMRRSTDYVLLMQRAASSKEYIFHFHTSDFNALQSRVLQILEEIHGNRYGRDALLSVELDDLILNMNRIVYEEEHPRGVQDNGDLLQSLTLYIDAHLEEDLSLEQLSREFYLSRYYIAHFFKDSLGISVHQYITKKRLALCRNAIMAGADISKTFTDYGFSDYSAFYRAFKKEYGLSPKELRDVTHMTR